MAAKKRHWVIDKSFPIVISTGMLIQIIVWIWLGATFYTQTNERFAAIGEARKATGEQMVALQSSQIKLQESTNLILIQLSSMTEKYNTQNEALKSMSADLRDLLRPPTRR